MWKLSQCPGGKGGRWEPEVGVLKVGEISEFLLRVEPTSFPGGFNIGYRLGEEKKESWKMIIWKERVIFTEMGETRRCGVNISCSHWSMLSLKYLLDIKIKF